MSDAICASCKCELGTGTDEQPNFYADGDGGRQEAFCSQCTCWVRRPLDPTRHYPAGLVATACPSCRYAHTRHQGTPGHCPRCLSRCASWVVLPPKPATNDYAERILLARADREGKIDVDRAKRDLKRARVSS